MEILYTQDVDTICLVSSDCDITPLATWADGKTVLGFGERKAPTAFVNSCSKLLFLDEVSQQITVEPVDASILKQTLSLLTYYDRQLKRLKMRMVGRN